MPLLLWKSIPLRGFQISPQATLAGTPFLRWWLLLCLPACWTMLVTPWKESAISHLKRAPWPRRPLQSLLLLFTSFYSCSSVESCIHVLFPFAHFLTLSRLESTPNMPWSLQLLLPGPWCPLHSKSIGYFPAFILLFRSIGLVVYPLLPEGSTWRIGRLVALAESRLKEHPPCEWRDPRS